MTARRLIRSLLSVVVAVLLLFLGWGIRDVPAFFALTPRLIFFPLLIGAMISAMVTLKAPPFRRGIQTPGGQRLLFAVLQIVTIALIVFLPYTDRREILVVGAEWVRWLGLAMYVGGNAIIILSLRTLGKNYSVYVTIQEQHQLVQSGMYRLVRHPIYLGNLLSWPGVCLVFRSWLVLPTLAFFLIFVTVRGAQEEKILAEHFGAEFDVYRSRTWRLVPHLY